MQDWAMLVGGLVLLVIGGELLVRGAVTFAERLGMSPLLIGLTLVGFGTTTPELLVSVQAALAGSSGIAVGNIVGSNIANILLILGFSALLAPITVQSMALKRDGALMLAAAALFALISWFYTLDRIVGVLLLALLAAYVVFAYVHEKRIATAAAAMPGSAAAEKAIAFDEMHPKSGPSGQAKKPSLGPVMSLLMALIGLAVVIFGGVWLVDGAVGVARGWGISETVIGLTVVAVGTSMPEFVTSLMAALRGHNDVALGNIIGSNIYAVLGIGGATALMRPTAVPPEIAHFDNPVMVGVSALLLVFAATGLRLGRIEGLLMLVGYGVYLYFLWPK